MIQTHKKRVVALGVLVFLFFCFCCRRGLSQYNPDGFILNRGWDILYPLLNPYGCEGGGEEKMLELWTAPYDLRDPHFAPKAGDRLEGMDFESSNSDGFDLGGITGSFPDNSSCMAEKVLHWVWPLMYSHLGARPIKKPISRR